MSLRKNSTGQQSRAQDAPSFCTSLKRDTATKPKKTQVHVCARGNMLMPVSPPRLCSSSPALQPPSPPCYSSLTPATMLASCTPAPWNPTPIGTGPSQTAEQLQRDSPPCWQHHRCHLVWLRWCLCQWWQAIQAPTGHDQRPAHGETRPDRGRASASSSARAHPPGAVAGGARGARGARAGDQRSGWAAA